MDRAVRFAERTKMNRNRRPRSLMRGFTVMELLMASTLAASMMVAVGGILTVVSKQQNEIVGNKKHDVPLERAISLVKWDFQVGHHVNIKERGFEITGFGGRNAREGIANQRPTVVTYFSRKISSGKSYLMRRQAYLDSEDVSEEPVYEGIQHIEVSATNTIGTAALAENIIPQALTIRFQIGEEFRTVDAVFDKLPFEPKARSKSNGTATSEL